MSPRLVNVAAWLAATLLATVVSHAGVDAVRDAARGGPSALTPSEESVTSLASERTGRDAERSDEVSTPEPGDDEDVPGSPEPTPTAVATPTRTPTRETATAEADPTTTPVDPAPPPSPEPSGPTTTTSVPEESAPTPPPTTNPVPTVTPEVPTVTPTPTLPVETPDVPVPEVVTYTTAGGSATISFSSERVDVILAAPNLGWSAGTSRLGPTRVLVTFTSVSSVIELEVWWSDGPRHEIRSS